MPATPGTAACPPSRPSGADLAGDARHLGGESIELIDHRVDGVLQLEDLALHVHGDLAREIATGDGGGHLGNIANLRRQVAGHGVDAVGQVLPCAGDARHRGLTAELAISSNLARDTRHLGGESIELVHHRVDGFLQLQDFATDVDGNLLRKVALGDRGGHLGDIADLAGQVAGHGVDAVGEVFPSAGNTPHNGLAAQLAFGADLTRDARHLAREGVELIHHRVDGFFQLEHFAAHIHANLLGQVAVGDCL